MTDTKDSSSTRTLPGEPEKHWCEQAAHYYETCEVLRGKLATEERLWSTNTTTIRVFTVLAPVLFLLGAFVGRFWR